MNYPAPSTEPVLTGPISVQCPACMASPGFPCTQPRSNDRWAVAWFHTSREARAIGFGETR